MHQHQHHFPGTTGPAPGPPATGPWPSQAGRESTTPPPGRPSPVPRPCRPASLGRAMCEPLSGRAVPVPVPISPGRQVVSTLAGPRPRASGQTVPHLAATGGKDRPPVRVSCQKSTPIRASGSSRGQGPGAGTPSKYNQDRKGRRLDDLRRRRLVRSAPRRLRAGRGRAGARPAPAPRGGGRRGRLPRARRRLRGQPRGSRYCDRGRPGALGGGARRCRLPGLRGEPQGRCPLQGALRPLGGQVRPSGRQGPGRPGPNRPPQLPTGWPATAPWPRA